MPPLASSSNRVYIHSPLNMSFQADSSVTKTNASKSATPVNMIARWLMVMGGMWEGRVYIFESVQPKRGGRSQWAGWDTRWRRKPMDKRPYWPHGSRWTPEMVQFSFFLCSSYYNKLQTITYPPQPINERVLKVCHHHCVCWLSLSGGKATISLFWIKRLVITLFGSCSERLLRGTTEHRFFYPIHSRDLRLHFTALRLMDLNRFSFNPYWNPCPPPQYWFRENVLPDNRAQYWEQWLLWRMLKNF